MGIIKTLSVGHLWALNKAGSTCIEVCKLKCQANESSSITSTV